MSHTIRTWITLVTTVALVVWADLALANTRVALVIGNGAYVHSRPLVNPVRDVKAISEKLRSLGFRVESHIDRTKAEIDEILRRFVSRIDKADVALIFYAGHGIQVRGKNYIIPIDAKLGDVGDVQFELNEINKLVKAVEQKAKRTVVFLDACRDNPFVQSMRGYTRNVGTRGLATVNASLGTLIAYAAQPGAVASDGEGRHSPFTAALLQHLGEPGVSIAQSLTRVRRSVYHATDGKQIPQDYNSLLDDIYLSDLGVSSDLAQSLKQQIAAARAKIAALKQGKVADMKPREPKRVLPKISRKDGQRFRDCKVCPEMVVIPAGTFLIGSPQNEDRRLPSEGPQKEIEIGQQFAMGRFEITVAEFARYVKETGHDPKNQHDSYCWEWGSDQIRGRDNKKLHWQKPGYKIRQNFPVTCVSWHHANGFTRWLSKKTGNSYRLPSEAEWEYAARAGSKTMFHYGKRVNTRMANYASWSDKPFTGARLEKRWVGKPVIVRSFKPNGFGLYQMHGNVWEMVEDCYNFSHRLTPPDGQPYVRAGCPKRVRKGGSWQEYPWNMRSARRHPMGAYWREQGVGFRVVRELP